MMQHKTYFTIGEVPICLITPNQLSVEPSFAEYLSEPVESAICCSFEQVEHLPEVSDEADLLFEDGMHRIFGDGGQISQHFYIPYIGVPPLSMRQPDAFQRLDVSLKDGITVYFVERAAQYFSTTSGCFNALKIERLLMEARRLVLHASFISWEGKGIAFTAPSGTGKSTQADLWERYAGAKIINGDRMTLGMQDGVMTGYGLPVAGSSNIFLNESRPLKAIVLLEQSKENSIRRVRPREALPFLMREITLNRWNRTYMDVAMSVLSEVLMQVPVYRLGARIDEGAVRCLKEVLEAQM